jgi:hypothetical protein
MAEEDSLTEGDLKIKKQNPWPLVRERTIPTERRPHIDEI